MYLLIFNPFNPDVLPRVCLCFFFKHPRQTPRRQNLPVVSIWQLFVYGFLTLLLRTCLDNISPGHVMSTNMAAINPLIPWIFCLYFFKHPRQTPWRPELPVISIWQLVVFNPLTS
jgi:hypothetical protein